MAAGGRPDRTSRRRLAGVATALASLIATQAMGQVTRHANGEPLFVPGASVGSHAVRHPTHGRAGRTAAPLKPPAAARPPTPVSAPAPASIPIPPVPPPPPSLAPPIVVPVRPPPPPLPPTVMLNAPGEAIVGKDSLRLTFGPDSAALNPATDAAIRALVHGPGAAAPTEFTVTAFAAGVPEDLSAARRLSLSRALAVRSVLINEGVTSVRIYVKALGAPPAEDKPADRVDITINRNVPTTKASQ